MNKNVLMATNLIRTAKSLDSDSFFTSLVINCLNSVQKLCMLVTTPKVVFHTETFYHIGVKTATNHLYLS